jgi:hypothetical protein
MTFKDDLQKEMIDARVSSIKDDIHKFYIIYDRRDYSVTMQPDVDVTHRWLCFGYKLLEPGQKIWDELVRLGFQPKFTWGGGCGGPPRIYVRW